MICEGCVFHKKIVERGQDACGRCDDDLTGIKTCINADYHRSCKDRMTRRDVASLAREHEALKKEKERATELLDIVQRVIAGMLKEGDGGDKKV